MMLPDPPRPTWRKPLGILALLLGLVIYALAIATAADTIGRWPTLVQLPVYVVLGTVWILPLRRFLTWMETGSFR